MPLILGFVIAALGIIPPGLINMTAAKVCVKEGRNEAISFASGATIIIFFQTYFALFFAKLIYGRKDIINILQEIGLVLFIGLTIYFFWIAKKPIKINPKIKPHTKTNRFFLGILLSALNLFPIPYYVFVTVSLSAYGYFFFESLFIFSFVIGAILGSFFVFYLYIIFFKKQEKKTSFLIHKGNYIIGSLTGLVSIITFMKLIKSYLM